MPPSKHSQATSCTPFWQTGSSKAGSAELKHHSIQLAALPHCPRVPHVPCVSLVSFLNLNVAVDLYSGPKLQTRARRNIPCGCLRCPRGASGRADTSHGLIYAAA